MNVSRTSIVLGEEFNRVLAENATLRAALDEAEKTLIELHKYGAIAVNQIICLGGEDTCQPCENRERLAIALENADAALVSIAAAKKAGQHD